MCFHFLYTVQVNIVIQLITIHACFYVMELKKQKNTFCTRETSFCLNQKIISAQWIKSNWFNFIHYTETIFLSKTVIFWYISKKFFTMLHLKIFLKYWIILYIFRILLCVTSPLQFFNWKYTKCLTYRNKYKGTIYLLLWDHS